MTKMTALPRVVMAKDDVVAAAASEVSIDDAEDILSIADGNQEGYEDSSVHRRRQFHGSGIVSEVSSNFLTSDSACDTTDADNNSISQQNRKVLNESFSVLSESARTSRSFSVVQHGNPISSSMRTDMGDDDSVGVVSTLNGHVAAAGATIASNGCFFPRHPSLTGKLPSKIVKYATRRLRKTKLSTAEPLSSTIPTSVSVSSSTSVAVSMTPGGGVLPFVFHADIELGKLLGEGSFSSVYAIKSIQPPQTAMPSQAAGDGVTSTTTSATTQSESQSPPSSFPPADQLVVKLLRKKLIQNPPMLAACAADLVKEGLILSKLSHPNILSLHAWTPGGVNAYGVTGRHDAYFLVLGKLDHTLSEKLKEWRRDKYPQPSLTTSMSQIHTENTPITASNAKRQSTFKLFQSKAMLQTKMNAFWDRMQIISQLMEACVYLHSQKILHRDIKPDNIGVTAQGNVQLFDFDVARVIPSRNPHTTYKFTKRVGSPRYMSPECARGDPYNAKADVYTVTLLIHELYTLEKPYDDIPSDLHDDMVFYEAARPPVSLKWPIIFQNCLERGWSEIIHERPTMPKLHDDWNAEVLPCILHYKQRLYSKWNHTVNIPSPAVHNDNANLNTSKTKCLQPTSKSHFDEKTHTSTSTNTDKERRSVECE